MHLNQDFSKILVVLGFEIQGGRRRGRGRRRIWYPYKANGTKLLGLRLTFANFVEEGGKKLVRLSVCDFRRTFLLPLIYLFLVEIS